MRAIRIIVAAAVAAGTGALYAQDTRVAAQPAVRASSSEVAVAQAECRTAARRVLHDHGIERGYGPMPIKACNNITVATRGDRASTDTTAPSPNVTRGSEATR